MPVRPIVALLIETSNTYARELLHGIRDFLRKQGPWGLHLSEHGRGEVWPSWLDQWQGDGILARVDQPELAEKILSMKVPAVDLSFALEESPFPRVITDSEAVTRLTIEHLRERGFRHFGYCGDPRYHWSNLRRDLFSRGIEALGFECNVFSPTSPEMTWEEEMVVLTQWIKELPVPCGVMACYDVRGRQVLEACRRLGVLVPDEIGVIGVHNDDLLCDLCDPPLTSVSPNARRAGYEAAWLLQRMMQGERIAAESIFIQPLGVVTRQSTDVVAISDQRVAKAVRFIRDHACENISVSDVLKAVPVSRSWLERQFKQLLGTTPHEQILRVRLDRVKTMLVTTDLSLAQIAERVGFEHVEYLSVVFKRAVGMTPSLYRAETQT